MNNLQAYRFLVAWALSNVLLFVSALGLIYLAFLSSIFGLVALAPIGYLMSKVQIALIRHYLHWELPQWEAKTRQGSLVGSSSAFLVFLGASLAFAALAIPESSQSFLKSSLLFLLGFLPYISFRLLTALIQSQALPIHKPASWVWVNLEGGCLASFIVYLAWISHAQFLLLLLSLLMGISLCAMLTGSYLISVSVAAKQESPESARMLPVPF